MLLAIIFTAWAVFLAFVAWCLYDDDPYNNKPASSAATTLACICAIIACLCYSAPSARVHTVKNVSSYSVDTVTTTGSSDTTYIIKYVK